MKHSLPGGGGGRGDCGKEKGVYRRGGGGEKSGEEGFYL